MENKPQTVKVVQVVALHGKGEQSQSSQGTSDQGKVQENTTTEISTIEPKSILARNKNDVNWNYIQTTLEEIDNSWSIITIDLKSINVNNDDILLFNKNMDDALKYVKAKDKQNSLISIANVYSLIPKYKENYENDHKDIELSYAKSDVVSSYALIDINKWDNMLTIISDADNRILNLANSSNSDETLNKLYVLLKDYIKSINDKDVDLCYMKYYYLIQEFPEKN